MTQATAIDKNPSHAGFGRCHMFSRKFVAFPLIGRREKEHLTNTSGVACTLHPARQVAAEVTPTDASRCDTM